MSEVSTAIMAAIELALDVTYHDAPDDHRALAVVAETWTLAGYNDGSLGDCLAHARQDDVLERVRAARKGRHRRMLNADARGMLYALTVLAECGLITYASCAEASRQRWLARGGHEGVTA